MDKMFIRNVGYTLLLNPPQSRTKYVADSWILRRDDCLTYLKKFYSLIWILSIFHRKVAWW